MHQIDARRLLCPLPVIRTQNAVRKLQKGDELLVIATDPGVMQDIPAWCRVHGHQVVSAEKYELEFHIRVLVGE
ncbi:MAG: sulfurtransferase TusA family protein [Moraxellaceae bacterium]|nr:sulfurtransferase TusA family protein [Moraxellaceae bacterium]